MNQYISDIIEIAIREDIGTGDITTDNLITDDKQKAEAKIIAKESFIVAGLFMVKLVFTKFDENIKIDLKVKDGDKVKKNEILATIKGRTDALLKAERITINFLQRLSGIATNTKKYADEIKDFPTRLTDTRKTLPGWRSLEKYAVRIGGGVNHRMGLYDGVLIKDNHIAISGGIKNAVEKIKKNVSHLIKIEVETSNFKEIKEALAAKADIIMLDNMNLQEIKKAVKLINKKALIEVSGNITKKDLRKIAETGVDIISSGSLTHQAVAVDISMRINS